MTDTFADTVLINGFIYTADDKDTVCQAVAIKGEKILFVGSNKEIQEYTGKQTEIIDLNGKMVIPGIIDTHIHPPGLSLLDLYEVQLFGRNGIEGYVEAVRQFIEDNPGITAVYGRGWSWADLNGIERTKGPRKEHLDKIAMDVPIILRANDGHTLWLNSKALEVNNITARTEVPAGGVIEKNDITGELWGTLKESAMRLIALPEYSLEQYTNAMLAFQKKMHRFGITGILCMASLPLDTIFKAFDKLRRAGKLHLRVGGAIMVNPDENLEVQFAAIKTKMNEYSLPYLRVISAKFFADGVVEGGTSHLLQPYMAGAGKGDNYYGDFLWEADRLSEAFAMANKLGLSIHVHSTGDGSTHKVLNALEYAQTKVPGNHRNVITHLQLVADEDIPRFKKLNVIASVQPYWHFKGPDWWHNVDYQFLGRRAEEEFPLATFFTNDVVVTSSSDYPATIVPNPMLAIKVGVTRNIDNGALYGIEDITDIDDGRYLLNKKERATVRQMIKSFTINGAYTMFLDKELGSIEPGKLADLVVLDRNILAVDRLVIEKTRVVMTFFSGKLVYSMTHPVA